MIAKPEGLSPRDIAVSGMKAQRVRMSVIANNVANAMTTRTPQGGAFRRQLAIFRGENIRPTVDPAKFGVRVKAVQSDLSPLRPVFDPTHPDANADGYVLYPNVNVSEEMVNLVAAQRAYEANVAVIASAGRMNDKSLELLRV
jgi:flagellar basal-body rod protein FlgC